MATTSGSSWSEAQALTRAAPTTSATDGQSLKDMSAVYVVLEADSGQTLSGGGTLKCYLYDAFLAVWVYTPGLDLNVPASASGLRRIAFPALKVDAPRGGRLLYAASSVTVSSGTCTVYQLAQALPAQQVY